MDLLKVEENAVTVGLSWTDCALLAHIIRAARDHDALPTAKGGPSAGGGEAA